MTSPSCGAATLSAGGVALARTWRCTRLTFPAASTARTATVLAPGVSAACAAKLPSAATFTAAPFTLKTKALASLTAPVTLVASAAMRAPSSGVVTSSAGGVESTKTVNVACAELPAASVAARAIWFLPSASASSAR